MDKERAKFVLQSFRPDGADADDVDFEEALKLATSDRELGEWLMKERAFDAEFAEAIARVDLPKGLVANVLLAMAQNDGVSFQEEKQAEGEMVDAMASIQVPGGLRERVLESMERSVVKEKPSKNWAKVLIPFAAAAGIAMAFFFTGKDRQPEISSNTSTPISVEAIPASFVRTYESPIFSLDVRKKDTDKLVEHLRAEGLPCAGGEFPEGLIELDAIGCREITIDGKRGSLLCFDGETGVVHLVIFRAGDVKGSLPGVDNPLVKQDGTWASAAWEEQGYAFCLIGNMETKNLTRYF